MKNFIILFVLALLGLLSSCAEDKGNYEYKTLNSIEIQGFKPANENNGVYTVIQGKHLTITPELKQALKKDDDLSYLWLINADTVSRERNLDIDVNFSYGEKNCCYIVIDNKTNIRYYHRFSLVVTSPFNDGYYILAEQEDHTGLVSFLSSVNENPEFVSTDHIGGIRLGNYPTYATCEYGYDVNYNARWGLSFITNEGTYKMIETNTLNFMPTATLNESAFIAGNPENYQFNPTYLHTTVTDGKFFISNGQLIAFVKGVLYRPAKLNDVSLAPWLCSLYTMIPMLVGFDNNQHKFIHLRPEEDDPVAGTVGDPNTCDQLVEIQNSDIVSSAEEIVNGTLDGTSPIVKAITRDATHLHFYTIDLSDMENPQMSEDANVAVEGLNKQTQAILSGKTWYILVGNSIYKSPMLLPELTKIKEIPAELGEVQAFNLCSLDEKLIVATYDIHSNETLKGSVYFLNSETGEILEPHYPNVTAKAVSILNTDYTPW